MYIKIKVKVGIIDMETLDEVTNETLKEDISRLSPDDKLVFLGFDEEVLAMEIGVFNRAKEKVHSYYYLSEDEYYQDAHTLFLKDVKATLGMEQEPTLRFACEMLLGMSVEDLQVRMEKYT